MSNDVMTFFLDQIMAELKAFSEMDIEKVKKGDYSLKLVLEKTPSCKGRIIKNENGVTDFNDVFEQLNHCSDRNKGVEILQQHFGKRAELERFAKHFHVHIMRQDKIDKIREKIIEAIIGSRLNSQAIQFDCERD